MNQRNEAHLPVMVEEVLSFFEGKSLKVFFDGTLGAGGHAEALLSAHPEIETYIGCDQDGKALALAKERLKKWGSKVEFVSSNFRDLDRVLEKRGLAKVDGFFLIWGCHPCN